MFKGIYSVSLHACTWLGSLQGVYVFLLPDLCRIRWLQGQKHFDIVKELAKDCSENQTGVKESQGKSLD